MPHCNIKIGAVGDPVLFPEHAGKTIEATLAGMGILENGTKDGRCACGIYGQMPDGKMVWIQVTARMFLGMAAAVRGATERFGDPP